MQREARMLRMFLGEHATSEQLVRRHVRPACERFDAEEEDRTDTENILNHILDAYPEYRDEIGSAPVNKEGVTLLVWARSRSIAF